MTNAIAAVLSANSLKQNRNERSFETATGLHGIIPSLNGSEPIIWIALAGRNLLCDSHPGALVLSAMVVMLFAAFEGFAGYHAGALWDALTGRESVLRLSEGVALG